MEGLALVAYPAMTIALVAAVVFSHVHAPMPRTRRVMRRLGFAVHILGVVVIVAAAVDALLLYLGGGNPFVFLGAGITAAAVWWISGGIAMRFGVRRDELFWWRRVAI
jgi:hypothetical protein